MKIQFIKNNYFLKNFFIKKEFILKQSNKFKKCWQQRRSIITVKPDEELSFAFITPRSIAKARVGGIIARLLSTPGLTLVGARMYAPSVEFQKEYVKILEDAGKEDGYVDKYEQALVDFVANNLTEEQCLSEGIHNRCLLLLFKGKNTLQTLINVIGVNLPKPSEYGKTIRGTYGEYSESNGTIIQFQPAVLTASSPNSNRLTLDLFARYAEKDGGIMKPIKQNPKSETGLVMIKPDNLERPSALPGHIIDLFGTTGLHLVGTSVFSMSVAQATEFYGFLEKVFVNKLSKNVEKCLRACLPSQFDFELTDSDFISMTGKFFKKNFHF
jgi:nucleoside diphosphate kinase